MEKKRFMIFTADDFGISPQADERILKLAEAGVLDRVAVMTRGTATKESFDRLAKSGVKLDLHAELREDIDPHRTLKAGVFGRATLFVMSIFFGENRVALVEKRWESQIRDFSILFGRYPDGLNSHEHTHFFPPYFGISVRLAKRYNIPFLRFGREYSSQLTLVSCILNVLRCVNKRTFFRSGLDSSDRMISFDWIGTLDRFKDDSEGKTVEILFHPERDEEMEFLETNFLSSSSNG